MKNASKKRAHSSYSHMSHVNSVTPSKSWRNILVDLLISHSHPITRFISFHSIPKRPFNYQLIESLIVFIIKSMSIIIEKKIIRSNDKICVVSNSDTVVDGIISNGHVTDRTVSHRAEGQREGD